MSRPEPTSAAASQAGDVREALADRLLRRAQEDEKCAENSEVVVAALAPEMNKFQERTGHNVYAVRMAVDHRSSAKKDRQYAADLREAVAALQPAPVAPQPAIKPLDWSETEDYPPLLDAKVGPGLRTIAESIVGRYEIDSFDGDKTFMLFTPTPGGENSSKHSSLHEAYAAAQAHFEALIRSAFVQQGEPS